jgi:hypothetical protein
MQQIGRYEVLQEIGHGAMGEGESLDVLITRRAPRLPCHKEWDTWCKPAARFNTRTGAV